MTNRTRAGIVLLVLASGLVGCGRDHQSPTGPSTPSTPPTADPTTPVPDGALVAKGTVYDTARRTSPCLSKAGSLTRAVPWLEW